MKILVCIKQVPENMEFLHVNSQGTEVIIPVNMKYRMNRFDTHAVEAAIAIKEQIQETVIDIITVGPESSISIVKRAMGMGADNGFIIPDDSKSYSSPSDISSQLASFARDKQYDLILTGIMSEDEMNAQTGQMLAARLGISSITGIVNIHLMKDKIYLEREREGGIREFLYSNLNKNQTILLTIQAGINTPRYPSLSALLKANNREITIVQSTSSKEKNDQSIIQIKKSEKLRQGVHLEGSIEDKARKFIDMMKERNVLI
jgi:electron transfer flavoprotein beta subunit